MNQKRKEQRQEVTIVGREEVQTAPQQRVQAPRKIDVPISFDSWWLQVQGKYNLRPELKSSIQKHFEARGFMDYKKFNEGLRDFGFRT